MHAVMREEGGAETVAGGKRAPTIVPGVVPVEKGVTLMSLQIVYRIGVTLMSLLMSTAEE